MSDKLRKILPCINARQRILENFPDSDRELLTDFRTKFIILPKNIKVVKAITTSAGDQLFIATYKKKQRTKQVIIFFILNLLKSWKRVFNLMLGSKITIFELEFFLFL